MSGSGPSLAPAVITAVVSVVALAVNYQIGIRGLRHTAARDIAKLALEFKLQKLNLFGRLLLLIDRSKMLYDKLIEEKPKDWHLLSHVDEVLANEVDRNLARAILDVNTTIYRIINKHGGLIGGEAPKSLSDFMKHFKFVESALKKKPLPKIGEHEFYPKQFDIDIKTAYDVLQKDVDATLRRYERMLREVEEEGQYHSVDPMGANECHR